MQQVALLPVGPTAQPGQEVALADPRLAPDDLPEMSPLAMRLFRMADQLLELPAVYALDVHLGPRGVVDRVGGKRIGLEHVLSEVVHHIFFDT